MSETAYIVMISPNQGKAYVGVKTSNYIPMFLNKEDAIKHLERAYQFFTKKEKDNKDKHIGKKWYRVVKVEVKVNETTRNTKRA